MVDYLNTLNPVQRQAVECIDGPVMVIAGPGSGKTRVLTYRVAHLMRSGIAPWNILCLTFTNKAAREMKERIETVVGIDVRKVWAGTFHSIFARILRIESPKLGYPSDFTIYDTDDTKSVISEIIQTMGLDKKNYNPNNVRSRISAAKSNLITPKMYAQNSELIDYDRMNRMPMIYKIYERYAHKCFRAGAMDFDDLLLQMYRLLYENKDNVKQKYQHAFRYVLVDEFQDTNYLQYAIIKELVNYPGSPENICVVGDDAQSIYSFRGATIENILQFESDFPATQTFKLEQNYRSTDPIIHAANQLITHNRNQIQKKIWTENEGGSKIKILQILSDTEEGRRVADLILEQKNRNHITNRDFAILYRTNAQSRVFEEHLRRNNIAYKVFGGLSFYQRKEVKDLLAYLRLAVNPKDDEALKRVINYPRRGIGKKSVENLIDQATESDQSIWDMLHNGNIKGRSARMIEQFSQMIGSFGRKASEQDAYTTAMHIAKHSGVLAAMREDTSMEGIGRLQNLTALLDGIKEFIDADEAEDIGDVQDKTLSSYLQNIALLTDFDTSEESTDYVSLMSVHAAKGLEFESVFVVGMEENLFPSFMAMSDPNQLDEERRLFYVAITRAKKLLCLSFAKTRYQYGQVRFNDPSRFLKEIPEECFDTVINLGQQTNGLPSEPKRLRRIAPLPKPKLPKLDIDVSDFRPSPSHTIKEGMTVLHLKFGKGEVQKIEGNNANKVATIHFSQIDNPSRKIMLKFAKLQILE